MSCSAVILADTDLYAGPSTHRQGSKEVTMHPLRYRQGDSDVTESMATIRSPFWGYNTTLCVELNDEDLSCYSNKAESVSLRECPYDH